MGPRKQRGRHWVSAPVSREDFREPGQPVPVSVIGAHGGAGTTTVARLLGAADRGLCWPAIGDGHPPRALVAARTHASGLLAARRLLAMWQAGKCATGTYLTGLVLVPDLPEPLPVQLSGQIADLVSIIPTYWMPWLPNMRLSGSVPNDPPAARTEPAPVRRRGGGHHHSVVEQQHQGQDMHLHLIQVLALTLHTSIYNPGFGSAPPAVMAKAHTLMDIVAWTATSACVVGIAIVATMMGISHHRGTGSEHFASLGRVMAACVLIGTAGPLVQFLT